MSSTANPAQKMPKTTKAWTVEGQKGFESLKYNESREIPALGASEVLVKSMYLTDLKQHSVQDGLLITSQSRACPSTTEI